MIKRCLTSLVATLIVCFLACSSASARVCFLPDSTDCGEGDVVGSGNVDVPCQYSSCPAHNEAYQECYPERIYNNGGVNVECQQVRCKLSKSECEKQEADANNSQCCNFDSVSGCYYMGSCKLCNRDVFDSEKNLGEGYDCHPCKDKNGTFYNCTAIEKECQDINSKYTSSCSDTQTAEEVEGVKDSHGNQCYTCKDKPLEIVKPVITITYKETYNSLTPSAGADPEEYYYQTLKFTATSSDNISRTILMKTYPAITCSKPQYTTGSPVTINERTETIIGSRCGTQSRQLLVSSVAALDTFINGTKVYSFEPYYSSRLVFDELDGKTVETNNYTVKFVKEQSCSDINIFYMNKEQAKLCNKKAVPLNVVGSDGQCYLCGITESCDGKESKIYYIAYPSYYLKGDVAYQSGCKCRPYLVKGISSNTDPLNPGGPININAISTPGGNSSSAEKIHLPTTLIGVSSSNPYSVKIDEFQCYGEEHCSAQVVKLDVLEKYVPDVVKKLKEDDDFSIDGGTFYDDFYYYTGRQFKPKSQSINTCDDYVVILGNGNPKACAQISSDYYNYHESCPKGLEKKRLPNVYDSTGAQCYECVKQSGDGSDPTCKPGTATIEYAYYYYYLHSDSNKPHSSPTGIPYGSIISKPTITYTNKATKTKITVNPFTQKTTLNIIHDSAGKRYDYTCSEFFGDSVSTGGGLIKPNIPTLDIENGKDYITGGGNSTSSTKWTCGYMLMTKANYTKATGRIVGGPLYTENAAGNNMYYGDNTFENVDLLKGIGCAGEYVLVFGCKK